MISGLLPILMIKIQDLNRSDYDGPEAPAYLKELLASIGGMNPHGLPNFRLVRAENRKTPSGGIWLDWLPGTTLEDRNRSKGHTPWRRVIETRMVPRYGPETGWVLERWVPAKAYGSKERWNASTLVGGTMLIIADGGNLKYIPSQGEYPAYGDYEYTGFMYQTEELAEATVIPAVQALIRQLEELPTNPQRRMWQRAQIARMAADAAEKQYEEWGRDVVASVQPAFPGAFIGAGEKRPHSINEICKKLGITEHSGR